MDIAKLRETRAAKTPAERKQMRANAERAAAHGTAERQAEAHAVLEELDRLAAPPRRPEPPAPEELARQSLGERAARCFAEVPPSEAEHRLMSVLLANPNSTSAELTAAMGWDGDNAWHVRFGNMVERRLPWLAPRAEEGEGARTWLCGVLATAQQADRGWIWAMKPEVAEALAELGIAAAAPSQGSA